MSTKARKRVNAAMRDRARERRESVTPHEYHRKLLQRLVASFGVPASVLKSGPSPNYAAALMER